MKGSSAALFGLALVVVDSACGAAGRSQRRPADRAQLQLVLLCRRQRHSGSLRPGGRNRLRLIYNALWEEQVRTYEIFLQPDGTAGLNIGVLADQGNVGSSMHDRQRRRHTRAVDA